MATLSTMYLCLLQITLSGINFKLVQSDTYIVHMDISAMPKVFSDHSNWYAATLSSISDDIQHTSTTATIPKLIYTYNSVIHGFCASLSSSQLGLLKKTLGFIYSIKDAPVKADSTHTAEFLGLNSNYGAWPESDYGKDVIIGVIDSGVWPESESYRDHGMTEIPSRWRGKCISDISFNSSLCNKKLIGARFYNKGIITNKPYLNVTVNTTRDTDGHGTHTSSIAAGNYVEGASFFGYAQGTSKGIAPRARLAIYRALWADHAYESDVIAAIDQAIEDGVDILSISMRWGSRFFLYEDPIAIATFAAMQKGIFVATSAGNDGPRHFSVGNGAPWVLTVGGSSVDRSFSGTIILGNGVSVIGESLYLGSSLNKVPLVYMSYCSDWEAMQKVGHKIVVCLGDDNDIQNIIHVYLESARVAGAIIICTTIQMEDYIQSSFPATFVNEHDGQPILDYINKSTNPKVTLEFHKTKIGTKPAPVVGQYSGRGPSASCPGVLKPDVVAPGTTILASWPTNIPVMYSGSDVIFSPFNILYGTSMACPHAAGIAALLKGKHPEWSPAAIRSAMMTTADVLENTLHPVKEFVDSFGGLAPASALAMGAGHINPNKALDPGLIYDAKADDYVRFLCSMNFTKNQIKMITRSSQQNCSNPSSDINYPSFIAFFIASESSLITQSVQEFRRTLTNVGDATSTYIANLTQMNEVKVSVVPKKLVFKRKYEKLSYTLTMKGPTRLNDMAVDGSISWIDVKGKHVVKSPIVATRLNPDHIED